MHSTEGPGGALTPGSEHPPEGTAGEHGDDGGHVHLPPPSVWPVTSAFGVALVGLGLVTAWYFWVSGLIIMGFGVSSWIQELRHEPH
jgi:hypothetical protein